MVITEWIFAEEPTDIKICRQNQLVDVHLITDQGTLIISLTLSQANELKEKLARKELS